MLHGRYFVRPLLLGERNRSRAYWFSNGYTPTLKPSWNTCYFFLSSRPNSRVPLKRTEYSIQISISNTLWIIKKKWKKMKKKNESTFQGDRFYRTLFIRTFSYFHFRANRIRFENYARKVPFDYCFSRSTSFLEND